MGASVALRVSSSTQHGIGPNDFDPAHSDAGFLVEFASGVEPGLNAILGAKADLEARLGRGVDLVEPGAVRNPYVLANINRHHEIIFSAKD